jgi:hypothetical protein
MIELVPNDCFGSGECDRTRRVPDPMLAIILGIWMTLKRRPPGPRDAHAAVEEAKVIDLPGAFAPAGLLPLDVPW